MVGQEIIHDITQRLQGIDGIIGVVLGGSRANGTHMPDSDIDLGIYYEPDNPPDIAALNRLANEIDDEGRTDLVTPLGGWGPWINGGGWLKMQGLSVDLLYRDVRKAAGIIDDCSAGRIGIVYQPGHPHGFATHIYMAEIAHCQIQWDPTGMLAELKSRTMPYPSRLKDAIIGEFFWEAQFSILIARKGISRADTSYTAGCCFRCVACLMQTLFALNGRYQMNEKGSVGQAAAFPLCPPGLRSRIDTVFCRLDAETAAVQDAIDLLETVVHDVGRLVGQSDRQTGIAEEQQ